MLDRYLKKYLRDRIEKGMVDIMDSNRLHGGSLCRCNMLAYIAFLIVLALLLSIKRNIPTPGLGTESFICLVDYGKFHLVCRARSISQVQFDFGIALHVS